MTAEGHFSWEVCPPVGQGEGSPQARDKTNPRVLIIDDDKLIRELLSDLFESRGYDVTGASSGIEGLKKLRRSRFDVVITDFKMPEMDGMTVTKKAKEIDQNVEIIMITGYGSDDAEVEAIRSGASAFLRKPFRLENILGMLEKVLANKRSQR